MITEKDFTKIYHQYANKILRLCIGYASGDHELAKEWVQETFVKVWIHRHSFKGNSSIETWIYRIAVNVCLSDLRNHRKNSPINESVLSKRETNHDPNLEEHRLQKMYECIDQLNEQNKILIILELEEVPQMTIAETVGLAHGSLRTRLSRIRKSLLKCIENGKRPLE